MLELFGLTKRWILNFIGIKPNRVSFILLVRLFILYRKKPFTPGILSDGKWTIEYTDARSMFYTYFEIFIREIYKLDKSPESEINILDVGSNIGLSVLYYNERYPASKITCMEPDPIIFEILEGNLKRNNISNVKLLKKAAWIRDENLNFSSNKSDGGHINTESKTDLIIEGTDIKKIVDNEKFDFIKFDIEGAEFDVFDYVKESLAKCPRIFLEYHALKNKKSILGNIISFFSAEGFRVSLLSLSPNWSPFVNREEGPFDGQYNIWMMK